MSEFHRLDSNQVNHQPLAPPWFSAAPGAAPRSKEVEDAIALPDRTHHAASSSWPYYLVTRTY